MKYLEYFSFEVPGPEFSLWEELKAIIFIDSSIIWIFYFFI